LLRNHLLQSHSRAAMSSARIEIDEIELFHTVFKPSSLCIPLISPSFQVNVMFL
jgi:hypothetical protein